MEYFKTTSKIRAEVKSDYVFVRNREEIGGVIDATLNEKAAEQVAIALQQVSNETFSEVWNILKAIKGVRFDYASN